MSVLPIWHVASRQAGRLLHRNIHCNTATLSHTSWRNSVMAVTRVRSGITRTRGSVTRVLAPLDSRRLLKFQRISPQAASLRNRVTAASRALRSVDAASAYPA
jgi:hypothetical protein